MAAACNKSMGQCGCHWSKFSYAGRHQCLLEAKHAQLQLTMEKLEHCLVHPCL